FFSFQCRTTKTARPRHAPALLRRSASRRFRAGAVSPRISDSGCCANRAGRGDADAGVSDHRRTAAGQLAQIVWAGADAVIAGYADRLSGGAAAAEKAERAAERGC